MENPVVIHMTFIISALLLAYIDRLTSSSLLPKRQQDGDSSHQSESHGSQKASGRNRTNHRYFAFMSASEKLNPAKQPIGVGV